jgi:hypothetical protein
VILLDGLGLGAGAGLAAGLAAGFLEGLGLLDFFLINSPFMRAPQILREI